MKDKTGFFAAKALLRAFAHKKGVPDFKVDPSQTPHYDPNTHTVTCAGVPTGDVSPDALTNFRAALDHELSESQVTEWPQEVFRRYGAKGNEPKGLGELCNGIGDVKVDQWIAGQYPGTELNIYRAIKIDMEKFGIFNAIEPIDPSNPANRIKVIAVAARYIGDGACTVEEYTAMVPQMLPVIEKCRAELEAMEWDGDVGQLVDQAERLHALCMEDLPPEPGEGEGDDEGEGEGEGESGDSEGTEGDDSSQKSTGGGEDFADGDDSSQSPTEGGEEEESEEENTEGEGDGDEPEDGDDTEGEGDEPEPQPEADFDWDIGQNMMDRWADAVASGSNWVVGDGTNDEVLEEKDVVPAPYTRVGTSEQRVHERLGAALAIRVKRALETSTLRFRGNRDRGQIDPRNLYKVAAGLPNGFRKRLPTEANDTAVMLGIDASASMHNDYRFPLTRKMMFVWNVALDRLKVPLMVYQWSTGFSGVPNVSGYDPKTNRWTNFVSRHYGLDIRVLKEFDSPGNHPDTLNRLNTYATLNSTPTAEGLAFGLTRLSQRHERKKILFFLTDGMPDSCQKTGGRKGVETHAEAIQENLREAKRQGILVVVLGMDCDDVYGYFGDCWLRVTSAKDFVNVTSQKLVRIISNWRV
jgi:hypothetical protein